MDLCISCKDASVIRRWPVFVVSCCMYPALLTSLTRQYSMKSKELISLLLDGKVHSGECLANQLGVSRTAIWKQIRRAEEQGIRIKTIRGRGYQLVSDVDFLAAGTILGEISQSSRSNIALRVLEGVDSTNLEVIRLLDEGVHGMPVVIADRQTAGRGRRGRVWQSPRGENLYMSMGLELQGGFAALDGLSLVLGVAVAEALEGFGARGVGLKWPNDIFASDAKLGGILVELQGELQEGVVRVIAGIGINVHMSGVDGVDQPWSSLALAYPEIKWNRSRIAGAIVDAVIGAVEVFAEQGFAAFRERWQHRDIFRGRNLSALGGKASGIGYGIDDSGNYLLRTPEGVTPVRAGELSLRVAS